MALLAILIYVVGIGLSLWAAWRIVNYDPSKSKSNDNSNADYRPSSNFPKQVNSNNSNYTPPYTAVPKSDYSYKSETANTDINSGHIIEIFGSALTKGYSEKDAFKEINDVNSMIKRLRDKTNSDTELNNILKKEIGIRTLAALEILRLISKAFTTKVGFNNMGCRELIIGAISSNESCCNTDDYIKAGERGIGNNNNASEVSQQATYELIKSSIILRLIVIFVSDFNDNFSINNINTIYAGGDKSAALLKICLDEYAGRLTSGCTNMNLVKKRA